MISIISSPAVIAKDHSSNQGQISQIMATRCRKIIQWALHQNNKVIALGAFDWCAYGNDATTIAEIFQKILIDEGYNYYFYCIIFPIPEFHGSERSSNIDTFSAILGTSIRRIQ
jgi:uncharacterized protein (TIGR02452 family)